MQCPSSDQCTNSPLYSHYCQLKRELMALLLVPSMLNFDKTTTQISIIFCSVIYILTSRL